MKTYTVINTHTHERTTRVSRSEQFHLGRRGAGWYEGHGYLIQRHDNGREWNIHYPGGDGLPRIQADDVVDSLATAKHWARSHWEENQEPVRNSDLVP